MRSMNLCTKQVYGNVYGKWFKRCNYNLNNPYQSENNFESLDD